MNEQEKNKNIWKRANRILDIALNMVQGMGWQAESAIEEIRLYDGYSEPGYSSESGIVATGNWNSVSNYGHKTNTVQHITDLPGRISKLFEKMGIECEWSDEWTECSDCNKLVRTQGDCYGWTRSYAESDDGEALCVDCLQKDPESYLLTLEDRSDTANTMDCIDPCDHGYIKMNEDSYESGWYPGQNSDPHKVAKDLRDKGITRFLFGIDSVGQFDSKWSVYVHKDEEHLLNPIGPEYDDCDEECEECEECEDADYCPNPAAVADEVVQVVTTTVPKKEVPCKFCKTNLWEGEEYCWKCGLKDPTVVSKPTS